MKILSFTLVFLFLASISSVELFAEESNIVISETIASISSAVTFTELSFTQYGYGLAGAASLLSTILIRRNREYSQV